MTSQWYMYDQSTYTVCQPHPQARAIACSILGGGLGIKLSPPASFSKNSSSNIFFFVDVAYLL